MSGAVNRPRKSELEMIPVSFSFFLFFFIFLFYVMLFILLLLILQKLFHYYYYFFFFMKITFIFSCSGMFRNVPECSVFRVLSTRPYTYPKIQIKNKQASLLFLLVPLSFATYFLFGNNRGHEFNYFGIVVGKLEGVFR